MDYPSVRDAECGDLASSHSIRFLCDEFRKVGIDTSRVSFYQVLDEPLRGADLADEYFATTKADKAHATNYNGIYIKDVVKHDLERLDKFLLDVKPKVILCMSRLLLAYAFGGNSLHSFRGSMMDYLDMNVVITSDLYALYKDESLSMSWRADLDKLCRGLTENFAEGLSEFNITICPTFAECQNFFEGLLAEADLPHVKRVKVAFDVETRGGFISVAGFATSARDAFVIPFIDTEGLSYWTAHEELCIVKWMKELLGHPKVKRALQNGQYDKQYMVSVYGIDFDIDIDTMIEAHMLFTKGQQLSLSFLSSMFCSFYRYWKEDGKDFHKSFQSEEDYISYQRYNGYDCCYTFECAEVIPQAVRKNVNPFVYQMQRRMQNIVTKPVMRGLRFDKAKQQKWRAEHEALKRSYESWLNYMIPDQIVTKQGAAAWWDSPAKMSHLFYVQFGLEPVLDKKTKRPTTSDAALVELGKQEPILKPIFDILRDYRSLSKTLDSYLAAKPSPSDGRMRTQYMLAGTDTFRLASKIDAFGYGLNLQNLTKG